MLNGIWTQHFCTHVPAHIQLQYTVLHDIAIYVLETKMLTKFGIYAKYLTLLYGRFVQIYVSHMKSMQSTM